MWHFLAAWSEGFISTNLLTNLFHLHSDPWRQVPVSSTCLQMRTLRHRELKDLAPGCTAAKVDAKQQLPNTSLCEAFIGQRKPWAQALPLSHGGQGRAGTRTQGSELPGPPVLGVQWAMARGA